MKSVVKFFTLKIIIVAFCVFGTTTIFGQDLAKECNVLYEKFLYPGCDKNCGKDKLEKGLATAKEYIEKCGKLEGREEIKAYLLKQIPLIESRFEEEKNNELLYIPFNASVPAKDWDKTFDLGKQIIAKNPDLTLDISLILASIGFDNAAATPPVDKYNEEAITYAKMALQLMNEGKTSENYGAFQYIYKTRRCLDGKLNATGWMNYTIGYIMSVRQNQTKEALPYLYQSTQISCETKNVSKIYTLIGDWYLEEFKKLEKLKSAGEQETVETKSILALQRGYTERMLDAYARAYRIALESHNFFIITLRNKVKELYKSVYNGDLTGFDFYIKNVMNTPFIEPSTPVTPTPKN